MADEAAPSSLPRVSVIIPTFNRPALLKRALNSVVSQTFADFEVIVVDDCSRESMAPVIDEFHDARIHFQRNDSNQGEALSRNLAIGMAKGKYIAFLDDDDEWVPEKLKIQIDFMNQAPEETGGVYSKFLWMNSEDGSFLQTRYPLPHGRIPTGREEVHKTIIITNFIGTPSTVLLRKKCFQKAGLFDDRIVYGEDHDLWIRISEHYSFEYIDQVLVRCYVHPDRISSDIDVVMKGHQAMREKYPEHREYHGRKYCTIGERLCLSGNVKEGRKMFLNSIRSYPAYWRSYLNLFASLFGSGFYTKWERLRCKIAEGLRSSW